MGLDGRISFAIAMWRVVAVELTLRWNPVIRVYDDGNAGQIIPLVTGTIGLLETVSKKELSQLVDDETQSDMKGSRDRPRCRQAEHFQSYAQLATPKCGFEIMDLAKVEVSRYLFRMDCQTFVSSTHATRVASLDAYFTPHVFCTAMQEEKRMVYAVGTYFSCIGGSTAQAP